MTRRKASLMAIVLLIVFASALAAQQPAGAPSIDALMGAALHQQEVEGNLPAAAAIYRNVLADPRASRAVQAKALLQLGRVAEKFAPADAHAYYQRLTREFGDQSLMADEAARRLATVSAVPPGDRRAQQNAAPGRRQLWNKYTQFSAPSPDGRYVPFVTFDSDGRGSLLLRDLTANAERLLVQPDADVPPEGRNYPGESRFSHDGRLVAYGWKRTEGYQLRVIGADGTGARTLTKNPEHEWIAPMGWSPDGTRILVKVNARGDVGQIGWVSVATGALQVLKSAPWTALGGVALSPNGQFVAFDLQGAGTPGTRAIFLLMSDGSRQMPLTDGTSRDEVVAWTPDGRSVAYLTYRAGSPELWSLPITAEGTPGTAHLITRDMRGVLPLGFSRTGALLYSQIVSTGAAYVARADFATGEVADVRPISVNLIADFGADWSPDGKQIAYVAHRGTDIDRRFIAVYSVEDRSTREVVPADGLTIAVTGSHRFSPDGESYLVNGAGQTWRGTRAVDLATGRLQTLMTIPGGYAQSPQFLDGGKSLLYHPYVQLKGSGRLAIRDLETGSDREVAHRFQDLIGVGFQLSPDQKTIAMLPLFSKAPVASRLFAVPVDGGPAKPLVEVPANNNLWPYTWTPDGRHVIYSRGAQGERRAPGPREATSGIWFVPATGGDPRRLHLPAQIARDLRDLRVHSDGRQITFTASTNEIELWSMDNAVPVVPAPPR